MLVHQKLDLLGGAGPARLRIPGEVIVRRLARRPLLAAARPVFLPGLAPQPVRLAHVSLSALHIDREMVAAARGGSHAFPGPPGMKWPLPLPVMRSRVLVTRRDSHKSPG
jgi:hypothetical protein